MKHAVGDWIETQATVGLDVPGLQGTPTLSGEVLTASLVPKHILQASGRGRGVRAGETPRCQRGRGSNQ